MTVECENVQNLEVQNGGPPPCTILRIVTYIATVQSNAIRFNLAVSQSEDSLGVFDRFRSELSISL